jgi:hypothetical protein
MGKTIDLTGQRFGRLVVVGEAQRKPEHRHTKKMWECRCDCGGTRIAQGDNLRYGVTKSCGCMQREHLQKVLQNNAAKMIGRVYGDLTVIERAERPEETESKRQRKYNWYRCRCSCGNVVVKNSQYLAEAKRPNCGCRQREVKPASRKIGHDGQYVKLVRKDGTLQAQGSNGEMYGVMRNDRKCAQCKKTFDMYAGPQWAWRKQCKGKVLVFCSYGCIRKHDAAHPQRFVGTDY